MSDLLRARLVLGLQALLTLGILAWDGNNLVKAGMLLALWLVTFGRLAAFEIGLFVIACVFFSIMNTLSLAQGIFAFTYPDLLGMPWWEFFMWGFYLLHTMRMIRGESPTRVEPAVIFVAIGYILAFSLIPDQNLLLAVTATLLIIGLMRFHERLDLAYTGYMVLLGAVIEYTGVLSGQWGYPEGPDTLVPIWFVTLWGGVGFLLRRLVLPILKKYGYPGILSSSHSGS